MNNFQARVTSDGRVTIPAKVRKRLGLEPGLTVAFMIDEEGNVSLRRTYPTIASLAGAAGKLSKPMTWKKMRRIAIEGYVARKYGLNPEP
jgi:AbrB family looped-hinge helix DNA binding protein